MHYDDVKILQLLPSKLQSNLRQELHAPYVTRVPFFFTVTGMSRKVLTDVCKTAISEKCVINDEEVFTDSQTAKCVYVVVAGRLQYNHNMPHLRRSVTNGLWVSEAVLWLKWMHCAPLVSETSCELIIVQADTTREVMLNSVMILPFTKCYAKQFALSIAAAGPMWGQTDVWDDMQILNDVVTASWEDFENVSERLLTGSSPDRDTLPLSIQNSSDDA